REHDGTALYYYRARYYNPSLHRFVSQDPIGFRGSGINLYSYVSNNPLNARDPRGLCGAPASPPSGGNYSTTVTAGPPLPPVPAGPFIPLIDPPPSPFWCGVCQIGLTVGCFGLCAPFPWPVNFVCFVNCIYAAGLGCKTVCPQ